MNEEVTSMVVQEMEKNMKEKDQKLKELNEELEAKGDEIEYLSDNITALARRDSQNNNEIVAARETAIKVLEEFPDAESKIGIKIFGKLDEKPFIDACNGKEAEMEPGILYTMWEEKLRVTKWHPFKRVMIGNKIKVVVDEDDKELKDLREELGDGVMDAVKRSLEDINEHNPSGSYVVKKPWNFKENREATLGEVIALMGQQMKNLSYKLKRT